MINELTDPLVALPKRVLATPGFRTLSDAARAAFPPGTVIRDRDYPTQQHVKIHTPDGKRFSIHVDGSQHGFSLTLQSDPGRRATAKFEYFPDFISMVQALIGLLPQAV
jgi:hypothetical protein